MIFRPLAYACLFLALAPTIALCQGESESEKKWAEKMREIVFQNDSQWTDNRWQQTDVGPFLGAMVDTPKGPVLRGISIKVGDQSQATVCFDTANLAQRVSWTGGFLKYGEARFGLTRRPKAIGDPFSWLPDGPGWANADGNFDITNAQRNWPGQTKGITHLPKDWAHYKGLYKNGKRIVLEYTVGEVRILDSPWLVSTDGTIAITRTLQIAPSTKSLQVRLCDSGKTVRLANPDPNLEIVGNKIQTLKIAARDETLSVTIMIFQPKIDQDSIRTLTDRARQLPTLEHLTQPGTRLWNQELITEGKTTEADDAYVIDTLTIPFDNPWKALFFTAGHDFFSTGDAAVCTVHGDVWVVRGVDRGLTRLRWHRFATGLNQPLGLRIVDDKVYVMCHDGVVRLHDNNNDNEADFYENFNNDLWVTGGGHDYVACLDTDPDGNFLFIHARTGVMRLSKNGKNLVSVADGFRNPNGMGVSPLGTITAAPQQGTWTPASNITIVKPGRYYGFGGPKVTAEQPLGYDEPMCYIPRDMDNSGGGQTWVTGNRFGPLENQMLHTSFGQCRLLLAIPESIDGQIQGGTIKFPTTPADCDSGIMRARFNPADGQLYVSGLRGWQTRAVRDGCLQRIRYTGRPVQLPTKVQTHANGVSLTFTDPLDRDTAQDPDAYFVEQWNYKWTKQYGSPDFKASNSGETGRDEVIVKSATLTNEGHTIFLEITNLQPVDQLGISWTLKSASGEELSQTFMHTIHRVPSVRFPESKIVRVPRHRFVSEQVERRLKPGLPLQFTSAVSNEFLPDVRMARLPAIHQNIDQPPSNFATAGAFHMSINGYLKLDLSGSYAFRIHGNGNATFSIDDKQIDIRQRNSDEVHLVRRGVHRISIAYDSPFEGVAKMKLQWKGDGFDWEPLPPEMFFHDPESPDIKASHRLRDGVNLIRSSRCALCHSTLQPSVESEAGPNLVGSGDRLNQQWVYNWLLNPQAYRLDSHMPMMFGNADQDNAKQDAADIAQFLAQSHAAQESAPTVDVPSISKGETIFEVQGCIGCHRFTSPLEEDEFQRISLHFVGEKYRKNQLAQFLRKPHAHFQTSRMPDFALSDEEAIHLAAYIRQESKGKLKATPVVGDFARGLTLYNDLGCVDCHGQTSQQLRKISAYSSLAIHEAEASTRGCLSASASENPGSRAPKYQFNEAQRETVRSAIKAIAGKKAFEHPAERSRRLVEQLRCSTCHSRDNLNATLPILIAEEGSGILPKSPPSLTWAGEKLWIDWTHDFLRGKIQQKPRPWLKARMPSYPAHAEAISVGLAAEHGLHSAQKPTHPFDASQLENGIALTTTRGFDCRQCHAIGDIQPKGDDKTKIHLGINLAATRERIRPDYFKRFVLNPARYEKGSNMPKLSEDGVSTKVKKILDSDAKAQFSAIWSYIQSLDGIR